MKNMPLWGCVLTCLADLCLFLAPTPSSAQAVRTGSYRLYSGPELPVRQVAILATTSNKAWEKRSSGPELGLVSIDGTVGPGTSRFIRLDGDLRTKGYTNLFKLEILPGHHRFSFVCVNNIVDSFASEKALEVDFKPGMLYMAQAEIDMQPWDPTWTPKVVEVGLIPEGYKRPTKSCESLAPDLKGCLRPVEAGARQEVSVPRTRSISTSITVEFTIGGVTFSMDSGDVHQILAGRELVARAAEDLDLGKEPDKAEFLARYTKEREGHPELANLVIKCKQFQLP